MPAHAEHAGLIRLRAEDWDEVSPFMEPREALRRSVAGSTEAWTALVDGEPAAMWGYRAPMLLGPVARVWLLTGEPVWGQKKELLRRARGFVQGLSRRYPRLEATVGLDYRGACRMVGWLGFRQVDGMTVGGRRYAVMRHGD